MQKVSTCFSENEWWRSNNMVQVSDSVSFYLILQISHTVTLSLQCLTVAYLSIGTEYVLVSI